MIDPKGIELTPYDGVPHLISPVIRETEDFAPALEGLIEVMHQRYQLLRQSGARNIVTYNEKLIDHCPSWY